jgi:hypothetical protein
MPAPWNSYSACLLAKSDRIGGDRLDLLNRGHVIPPGREVHHQSGGSAPWNVYPVKSKGYFTGLYSCEPMGITPLKIVKPQIFGHTLLKSIDIALRKFPQPYYDIEFVNFC